MRITFCLIALFCAISLASSQDCPPLKPRSYYPNNARDVRPDDIRVVMALGDSITAGFAMHDTSFFNGLFEYRGKSFSIGGDAGAVTIPNLLRNYNPNLIGFSQGRSLPLDTVLRNNYSIIPHNPKIDRLNAAQSNAKLQHLFAQVDYLEKQISKNADINVNEDWKLLTILIGANNLCVVCYDDPLSTVDYWSWALDLLFQRIHEAFPRTIINLLPLFDIPQVYNLSRPGEACVLFQKLIGECPCMRESDASRTKMLEITDQYNERTFQIVENWQNKKLDDFAVVIQPFTLNITLTRENVSKLDCFHPSELSDRAMAVSLWNNMLTPVDKKSQVIDYNAKPICPTDSTLIYTY